jgi:hypothetical protein
MDKRFSTVDKRFEAQQAVMKAGFDAMDKAVRGNRQAVRGAAGRDEGGFRRDGRAALRE